MSEFPIAEAAAETIILELSERFRPSGEMSLGTGFQDAMMAARFRPPSATLDMHNYRIKDVYLDTANMVLIKDGRKIPETAYLLSHDDWDKAQISHDKLIELVDDTDYVIGSNRSCNYYHWLVQAVPAIDWALRIRPDEDVVLILPELTAWQKDTLALLGYGGVPQFRLDVEKHYRFQRVEYSEFLTAKMPAGISTAARSTFRRLGEAAGNATPAPGPIIYVPHADPSRVAAVNEADLIRRLTEAGVHVVVPDSLSFAEQASLFRQVDAIIGCHGTALANVVFCRPGTLLYELMPQHYVDHSFNRLALSGGLHYWADLFPSHDDDAGQDQGWVIDIDAVLARVDSIQSRIADQETVSGPHNARHGAMDFLRNNRAAPTLASDRPPLDEEPMPPPRKPSFPRMLRSWLGR